MSIRKRVPAVAGGLGAVVLLGLAANFAIGGQHYNTPSHHSQKSAKAHNVIMLLGDGMGESEVTAARYYQYGAAGRMNIDRLPFTGFQTTWSVKPARRAVPAGLRPGLRVDRHDVGDRQEDDRRADLAGPEQRATRCRARTCETVLEVAAAPGKKTGNVSTAEITDATPAVLDSHISLRGCQGPNDTRDDVPDRDQGRRRPRLDRRADGRPQGRRRPRRRPRPLRAAARRRAGRRTSSTTPRPRATST